MKSKIKCVSGKVTFKTMENAHKRAMYINSQNINVPFLRPYQCTDCGFFHLTKMTKQEYRMKHDEEYRIRKKNKDTEVKFIMEESRYWNEQFVKEEIKNRKFKKKHSKEKPKNFVK